ncbi:hypothetical protein [uncultured Clostridium sp.]|uniref:hypothetical protein n=1 Tax=uncultured Clostridium sp. TaxID=59620 RepID=UPI0025F83A5B|nr:hypothetical protein [uncultured Clostridium sp.]
MNKIKRKEIIAELCSVNTEFNSAKKFLDNLLMIWIVTRILFVLCCAITPVLKSSIAGNIGGLIIAVFFVSAIKANRTVAVLPILGGFLGLFQFLLLTPVKAATAYPLYSISYLLVNIAQILIMFIIIFNKQIKYYESAIKESLSAGN